MNLHLIALSAAYLLYTTAAHAATDFKIVTASTRGTYIQIGHDIASLVAPSADINLEVLPSAGSAENVRRLRFEPGVKFAIVQSDVYQAFLDQSAGGNAEAGNLIRPLRVILPLYNEEIYFIVRSDSKIEYVHEIENAQINVGELGSGTALTTTTLYRLMFGRPIPDSNATFMSNEDALLKLVSDRTVDVVAVIAGQPARLLADMKADARQLIKLLRFDRSHPASQAALKTYFPATVRASSYPNLLTDDLPALAVKAVLVTYDYKTANTRGHLVNFARALCRNLPSLQEKGHPKWKEVRIAMPELGQGWFYYPPTARELKSCQTSRAASPAPGRTSGTCSQHEQVLGLCETNATPR